MKKFSKSTNQEVGIEPEITRVNEYSEFKGKVMRLMDDLLRVQMYGPITRYHVAGTMKVDGKELFLEALMDLLTEGGKKGKIELLESLKSDISDWESIDRKIESIKCEDTTTYLSRHKIKSVCEIYRGDSETLINQFTDMASRITDPEVAKSNAIACESLMSDGTLSPDILKRAAKVFSEKESELRSN